MVAFVILEIGTIKPTERGFFCDDESIKYPFIEETVNSLSLIAAAVIIPIVIVSILQFLSSTSEISL